MKREAGYTFVEIAFVMAVIVPVLFAVLSTGKLVRGTLNANDIASQVQAAAREKSERVGQLVRPAVLSTFRVRATQDDVDWAIANSLPAPTIGEWIAPRDNEPRPTLRFRSAQGKLSLNAAAMTEPRALELILHANEAANGDDDDGDGMIDEGTLYYTFDGFRTTLLDGVESCTFTIEGRMVRFRVGYARRDGSGTVHRATVERWFFVRNN